MKRFEIRAKSVKAFCFLGWFALVSCATYTSYGDGIYDDEIKFQKKESSRFSYRKSKEDFSLEKYRHRIKEMMDYNPSVSLVNPEKNDKEQIHLHLYPSHFWLSDYNDYFYTRSRGFYYDPFLDSYTLRWSNPYYYDYFYGYRYRWENPRYYYDSYYNPYYYYPYYFGGRYYYSHYNRPDVNRYVNMNSRRGGDATSQNYNFSNNNSSNTKRLYTPGSNGEYKTVRETSTRHNNEYSLPAQSYSRGYQRGVSQQPSSSSSSRVYHSSRRGG